jgi:hypothetical protein
MKGCGWFDAANRIEWVALRFCLVEQRGRYQVPPPRAKLRIIARGGPAPRPPPQAARERGRCGLPLDRVPHIGFSNSSTNSSILIGERNTIALPPEIVVAAPAT